MDKKKIQECVSYISSVTQAGGSPPLDEWYDFITKELGKNLEEAIIFLTEECSDEELETIAYCFDDIAAELDKQGRRSLLEAVNKIQTKFPDTDWSLERQELEDWLNS